MAEGMVCDVCDREQLVGKAGCDGGISLLRGHHDAADDVHYQYQLYVEVLPLSDSPIAAIGPVGLRVKFPPGYPKQKPKVLADPAPFHPNIDKDGTIPTFAGVRLHSMRALHNAYVEMLSSPRLSGAVNKEAASLVLDAEDSYRLLAAHSIGRPFPTWSLVAHADFPESIRAAIRALLLAVRVYERRACSRAAATTAAPILSTGALHWPAAQALPDDALHRIFAFYARDELRALCRRYGLPGGGWSGHACECYKMYGSVL